VDRIRKSLLVPALSALCAVTLLGSGDAQAQITHIDLPEIPELRLQSSGLFGDLLDDASSLLGDSRVQDYDYEDDEEDEAAPPPRKRSKRKRNRSSGGGGGGGGGGTTTSSYGGGGGISPQGKTMGLGIQVGAPTSVTFKFMLTGDQGVVVGVGAGSGFTFNPALSLHADYLWHPSVLVSNPPFKLSWYIGGGAWVGLWNGGFGGNNLVVPGFYYYFGFSPLLLAARMPIGLSLAMNELPLEFYGEATPALSIFPGVSFGLGFTLGFRFYF
jgi:hypothetical protein